MGTSRLNVLSLCFVVICCFQTSNSFPLIQEDPITDGLCKIVYCGEGTCIANPGGPIPPVVCECNQGWKPIETGPFKLGPCFLPNCTLDFGCGNATPPPPPSHLFPPVNFSDPCNYTSCGDGTCHRTSNFPFYECNCNAGSENLLNMSSFACFKQCIFGADSHGLGYGPPAPPPPESSDSRPNTNQSTEDLSLGGHQLISVTLLFVAVFVSWN